MATDKPLSITEEVKDKKSEITPKHKELTVRNGHSHSEHDSTRFKTISKFLYNTLVCEYLYSWY